MSETRTWEFKKSEFPQLGEYMLESSDGYAIRFKNDAELIAVAQGHIQFVPLKEYLAMKSVAQPIPSGGDPKLGWRDQPTPAAQPVRILAADFNQRMNSLLAELTDNEPPVSAEATKLHKIRAFLEMIPFEHRTAGEEAILEWVEVWLGDRVPPVAPPEALHYMQQLPGGMCFAHGHYEGTQCPQWPDCAKVSADHQRAVEGGSHDSVDCGYCIRMNNADCRLKVAPPEAEGAREWLEWTWLKDSYVSSTLSFGQIAEYLEAYAASKLAQKEAEISRLKDKIVSLTLEVARLTVKPMVEKERECER